MTLYKELSRKIKFGILRGDYPPGSRLPSLRVLAEQEKCNQATVKRAMQILGQEHLVQRLRYKEQADLTRKLYERLMPLGYSRGEILIMIQECGYGRPV